MATQTGVDAFQTFNISNGIAIQTAEVIVGPSVTDSIVITATGIDTWDGAFVQPTAKTASPSHTWTLRATKAQAG
jgi:hypothetical protein